MNAERDQRTFHFKNMTLAGSIYFPVHIIRKTSNILASPDVRHCFVQPNSSEVGRGGANALPQNDRGAKVRTAVPRVGGENRVPEHPARN